MTDETRPAWAVTLADQIGAAVGRELAKQLEDRLWMLRQDLVGEIRQGRQAPAPAVPPADPIAPPPGLDPNERARRLERDAALDVASLHASVPALLRRQLILERRQNRLEKAMNWTDQALERATGERLDGPPAPDTGPDLLGHIAQAMVTTARHRCQERNCGAEGRGRVGSNHGALRCRECPLNDVDAVTDALAARRGRED